MLAKLNVLKQLNPMELWYFLVFVFRSFNENQGIDSAKAMTYTSLFAVVPLLTITVNIMSFFPAFQIFATQVENMIFQRMLPGSGLQVQEYIQSFSDQARNLTWVGAAMLVVTAYLMLVNIERQFNLIWGIGEQRKGLSSFLLYWSVLSLSPLLLGMGFAVRAYITSLSLFQRFTDVTDFVGATHLTFVLLPILVTTLAFTLLYLAVPNCGVRIRHALVGGLVVALSFLVVKKLFSWTMSKMSFEFVYGTFAALPVFLIWIFMGWVVIFFGANMVRCLPLYRRERLMPTVHPTILVLALLHKFWVAHQKGEGVHIQELIRREWPFKTRRVDDYLEFLVEQKLIRAVDQDEYLLVRDLKGVSLWQLLEKVPWERITLADFAKPVPAVLEADLPGHEQWQAMVASVEAYFRDTYSDNLDSFFRSHSASPR